MSDLNLQIMHITHNILFFRRLKRVIIILSRSELDPFHHTVRTRNGLSPCDANTIIQKKNLKT